MGEGHSKHKLDPGKLSEEEIRELLNKFDLDEHAQAKAKISPNQFCSVFPRVLQPYVSQVLPALRDVSKSKAAKKLLKKKKTKLTFQKTHGGEDTGEGGRAGGKIASSIWRVHTAASLRSSHTQNTAATSHNDGHSNNSDKTNKHNYGDKHENMQISVTNNSSVKNEHPIHAHHFPHFVLLKHKKGKNIGQITAQELVHAVSVCVYAECPVIDKLLLAGFVNHANPSEHDKAFWKSAIASISNAIEVAVTSNGNNSFMNGNDYNNKYLFNNNNNNIIYQETSATYLSPTTNYLMNVSSIDSTPRSAHMLPTSSRNTNNNVYVNMMNNHKLNGTYTYMDDEEYEMKKNVLSVDGRRRTLRMEAALRQLITYAYLESIYLQTPTSPLFSSNPMAVPPPLSCSLNAEHDDEENDQPCERMNSWDVAAHFFQRQKINRPPMTFKPLIDSFRAYVEEHPNKKLNALAAEWLHMTLRYLPNTCKAALHGHLLCCGQHSNKDSKYNDQASPVQYSNAVGMYDNSLTDYHNYNAGGEGLESIIDRWKEYGEIQSMDHDTYSLCVNGMKKEEEANGGLPEPSPSMQKIELETGGWRGLWLCASSRCLTDETCFSLRQCSLLFQPNRWTRLYASWKQGTSFNRCVNAIIGYPSPSVVVVKTSTGQVFGGVCTGRWKESGHAYFGSTGGFLFSAFPVFKIFSATGLGQNFVYLNTKNQFYPKGLGFGGQPECFRLWLRDEFLDCYSTASDRTYEKGNICMNLPGLDFHDGDDASSDSGSTDEFLKKFIVQEMEVWGTGDAMALKIQAETKLSEEQARQGKRAGDKFHFLESEFDKEYLLGGTFGRAKGPVGCTV